MISILNYVNYEKDQAMEIITNKLEWEYYGGKHYESNYTKYYQGVILPDKFKIDKRKLHFSALILSNQISRDQALQNLEEPIYPKDQLEFDTEYVIKKLGIDKNDFDKILKDHPRVFFDYPNSYYLHGFFKKIFTFLRNKKLFYN